LLLRGPQTAAELRSRASRMTPIEDPEPALAGLLNRPEPLVKELPPVPGTRATRFAQLLCPTLHRPDDYSGSADAPGAVAPPAAADAGLADRITALEEEVSGLRRALQRLASSLGEADPTL
jgi:uncharacterized protein